jgi:hypothetical protein
VADRFVLPGADSLKPLRQGELTAMCGIVSWLNGIRLAAYPRVLRKPELQGLFLASMEHLSRKRQLKRVLGVGMGEEVWVPLGCALSEHCRDKLQLHLKLTPILSERDDRRSALRSIKRHIREGHPVVLAFYGTLDHYTVVRGVTNRSLLLFDGSGLRFVKQNGVGLETGKSRRHRICREGAVAIARN